MKLTLKNCRQVLVDNILPFWMENMLDSSNGGFYGRIDGTGRLHPGAPKAVILNTRILWTFSAASNQLTEEAYLSTAQRAFDYLINHFVDHQYGGVFWMLNSDGSPRETKKQVYAQAFAIYALSEFYMVRANKQALDMAKSLFSHVEEFSFDADKNGYLEAFDEKWLLLDDLRLSEKDANEAKTMNTHLHVLEAYTNLYKIWQDPLLGAQLENLVILFLDKFIDQDNHFHLFFDEDWNLKSQIHSYGHDIEGGWLLLRAAQILDNSKLIGRCERAAIDLTDAALRGLDIDGGLMYEGNTDGVINTDKHWWPQAEALVGLVNTYQICGDKKYMRLAESNWKFIQENLIDPNGEWHGILRKDGSLDLNEDKAGPWKAPYHNGRAMLEMMLRLANIENNHHE